MLHAILHAFLDTLKMAVVIYFVYFLVELFENKFSKKISNKKRGWSPLVGAGIGLIPQCGFSVVATDLFAKRHISIGTLVAIFIATSDEALPILLSSPENIGAILPLLLIKFVLAILIGFILDLVLKQDKLQVHEHTATCTKEVGGHIGCCHHGIEEESSGWVKNYLYHPLLHTLKICAYILVFNIIFELLVHFASEEAIIKFVLSSGGLAPILATFVGFIPNCVASVLLTELYCLGALSFGSAMAGLISNAGIAYIMLFKSNKNLKENLVVVLTIAVCAVASGYLINWIQALI